MWNIPRSRLMIGLFLLTFSLFIIWFCPRFLVLNFSNSIPRGLYLCVPTGTMQIGDIVEYMPTDDVLTFMRDNGWIGENQTPLPFLKYIGGLSGDTYSIQDRSFSINGQYIGETLDTDKKGQALPHLQGFYKVSDYEFLPLASNSGGFDGRYTGCVPINRIISKVIPIWVVD